MSNIGKGNPMIFYNSFQKSEQTTLGEILCEVNSTSPDDIGNFIESLRDTLNKFINARIYVYEFENGSPIDATIALRLVGENLDSTKVYSEKIEDIIKDNEGTTYIKNPLSQSLTDIRVVINSEKAGMFGVPTVEIDRTVRLGLSGISAGKYRDQGGKGILNKCTIAQEEFKYPFTLENIYVSSLTGAQIPLSQLARIEFEDSPTLIQHYNNERSMTISSSVKTGYNTDRVTKQILAKVRKSQTA